MARTKGSPRRLIVDERLVRALEMRRDGVPYRVICEELGYSSVPTLCTQVNGLLRHQFGDAAELIEDMRRLECERLDAQLRALWPAAMSGDVRANDCLLRVAARRAALLGLDAPVRRELSGPDGGPIELSDARERLIEAASKLVAPDDTGTEGSSDRGPTG